MLSNKCRTYKKMTKFNNNTRGYFNSTRQRLII